MGCTDPEACLYAGIVPSTLYRYQESNPEYSERKETLKQNPVMKARGVILKALDENDTFTAHKVIERKEGRKLAITGANEGPIEVKTIERIIVKA